MDQLHEWQLKDEHSMECLPRHSALRMGQKSGITLLGCQGGGIATLGAARFKVPWLNPWGRQIVAQIAEPKILARDIGPWAVVNGAACLTAPKQVQAFSMHC